MFERVERLYTVYLGLVSNLFRICLKFIEGLLRVHAMFSANLYGVCSRCFKVYLRFVDALLRVHSMFIQCLFCV